MKLAASPERCRSDRRRGSSLVEVMIVISVSATILLTAIGWIHQSFKLARMVKQKQQHHQQLMRLSDQFRQDVRLCRQATSDAEGRWILESDEHGKVIYTAEDALISRVYQSAETSQTQYEQYPLASGSTLHWDDTELPQWLTLVVRRSRGGSERAEHFAAEAPLDLRVRAAVGRWLIPEAAEVSQ